MYTPTVQVSEVPDSVVIRIRVPCAQWVGERPDILSKVNKSVLVYYPVSLQSPVPDRLKEEFRGHSHDVGYRLVERPGLVAVDQI